MKVLLISHNPISTQNNMGKTFLTLFSQFDAEELCQLYIYPTVPNCDRCASYYRITDKEVLKALLRWKKPGGELDKERIRESEGMYETPADEQLYRSQKNKSALRRLLRDCIWKLVKWYHADLEKWLDREAPTCIVVAPGAAGFIYDFALTIAKKRKIPIVTYICDEYYFVKNSGGFFESIRMALFKKKMQKLMHNTSHMVAISDELNQAYTDKFGVMASTVMTGAAVEIAKTPTALERTKDICYFGNIRCNRYLSLVQIGRALDEINQETGEEHKLKIYTFEKDAEILSCFDGISSIVLCGAVTGKDYEKTFRQAQLLLHTEAFDEESIDRVRHSVSTKIADSLASGIPLLAYGPSCVSSMKHLLKNRCAIAATREEDLRDMLRTALYDAPARMQAVENALAVASRCHDTKQIGKEVRQIICAVHNE